MKRITIKEIAKQAGVSVGTVDRVLHKRGEVAERTEKLVLKIAKEGNYTTNVFARNLKLNKTYNISIVLPEDNDYWKTLNNGIGDGIEEYSSLGMQLKTFPFDRSNHGSFLSKAHSAIDEKPDALILAPLMEKEAEEITNELEEREIPYVFVDSWLKNANPLAFIGQDSVQSGYLAAKLLNLGYENGKETWILKYANFDSVNKAIDERIEGFSNYYKDQNWDNGLIHEHQINDKSDLDQLVENGATDMFQFFVPNSRSHQIVNILSSLNLNVKYRLLGYDLILPNVKVLNSETIDFIIDQNPYRQGYLAIQALYKYMITKSVVDKNQFMPIEVVTKENLEYANSFKDAKK